MGERVTVYQFNGALYLDPGNDYPEGVDRIIGKFEVPHDNLVEFISLVRENRGSIEETILKLDELANRELQ